jgi:hypothetical protein
MILSLLIYIIISIILILFIPAMALCGCHKTGIVVGIFLLPLILVLLPLILIANWVFPIKDEKKEEDEKIDKFKKSKEFKHFNGFFKK